MGGPKAWARGWGWPRGTGLRWATEPDPPQPTQSPVRTQPAAHRALERGSRASRPLYHPLRWAPHRSVALAQIETTSPYAKFSGPVCCVERLTIRPSPQDRRRVARTVRPARGSPDRTRHSSRTPTRATILVPLAQIPPRAPARAGRDDRLSGGPPGLRMGSLRLADPRYLDRTPRRHRVLRRLRVASYAGGSRGPFHGVFTTVNDRGHRGAADRPLAPSPWSHPGGDAGRLDHVRRRGGRRARRSRPCWKSVASGSR